MISNVSILLILAERLLDSQVSRQSRGLFGRGLVRWDSRNALERWPGPKLVRRASPSTVCEADFECKHPAQLRGSDTWIRRYLDTARVFSGADWCAGTAEMPLRDCKGRNCCSPRVSEADFEGGPPPLVSRINPFALLYGLKFVRCSLAMDCSLFDHYFRMFFLCGCCKLYF